MPSNKYENQYTKHYNHLRNHHEKINKAVKALSAAMALAAHASEDSLASTVRTLTPKWKSGELVKPDSFRGEIPQLVARIVIVHASSIFEGYIRSIEGERGSRGGTITRKSYQDQDGEDDLSRVERFFIRSNWNWGSDEQDILRVHCFFQLLRNCVAHRGGRASDTYVKECASIENAWMTLEQRTRPAKRSQPEPGDMFEADVVDAMEDGDSKDASNILPLIPVCSEEELIPVTAPHVIMFSAVNLWLAGIVEERLASEFPHFR